MFSDVVTVNMSKEGKSKERYTYVVSCHPTESLRSPLLELLIPLHTIAERKNIAHGVGIIGDDFSCSLYKPNVRALYTMLCI